MDIGLILVLIVINGIFAMSEMALVSSRKTRLQKLSADRKSAANTALKLHAEPSRFLSTVQVGITSVGILSGALGEDALTMPLREQLSAIPWLAPYADGLALSLTVVLITYFSVVVGELVPKRLALLRPESIALFVARPMNALAVIASPLVWILSASSNVLLKIMRVNRTPQATVTNEEIKLLMELGSEAGVFHASEGHLVANVLKLDEQRVGAVMTPRQDMFVIDLEDESAEVMAQIAESDYSRVIICRGSLEHIVGILHRSDLLKIVMSGAEVNIAKTVRPALYVPDSMSLTHLLEFFRESKADFALIVDEYGELEGLVTLSDVLKAIVGDLPSEDDEFDPDIVRREDGSWLVDGGLSIKRFKSVVGIADDLPGESDNSYNTIGGFILFFLEKIPRVADHFEYADWHFEVVDIDGTRVDKVLVTLRQPD
jgi:putative hemolysin